MARRLHVAELRPMLVGDPPRFGLITDKAICRGSFGSVKQLIKRVDHFVAHYNQDCKAFTWTATADSILAKLSRLRARISGTTH